MKQEAERYCEILQRIALADEAEDSEPYLAAAFELGRDLVGRMVPPDEMVRIHHESMTRLARSQPSLRLEEVVDRLNKPLLEASMAYGMFFREQMEAHYQKTVEARVEQAHKLEVVGTLAAGIAHDFNNLLGSIIGFAELAGDDLPDDSLRKQNILQILAASFRARDLVARLLTFARQSPGVAVPVDIVGEVRDSLALLRVSYPPELQFRYQPCIERALVLADPVQIQQVVMNLCMNAADAMEHAGVVNVSIAAVAPEENASGKAGVCLTVADCGHGMLPEVQERIFDPFFTTKAPSQGSGLGLSVVYGIVTHLGGAITVNSRANGPLRGTEFRVVLPLMTKAGEVVAALNNVATIVQQKG